MATLVASPARRPTQTSGEATARVRHVAGVPFLLGVLLSFVGLAWDVQWHVDVGPDTFFTAPHLVFYGGVAITGLTALAVVLFTTSHLRRSGGASAADTIPILRGAFRGPAGFVIGGIGAAAFISYGLLDQWWHGLYGFDVTLVSPPHVGLILSILVSMVGCLVAFASDARRAAERGTSAVGGAIGLAASVAILVAFVTATLMDATAMIWPLHGQVDSGGVVIAALYAMVLLLVASVLRRPGSATLVALIFTVIRVVTWYLIPWLTLEYAAAIGLFLRDNTSGVAVLPGLMPAYLLAAGLAVDGLLLAGRRWGWDPRLIVPLAGAAAALLLRLLEPTLAAAVLGPEVTPSIRDEIVRLRAAEAGPTLVVVPIVGAAFGWIGWRLGIVLRRRGDPGLQSAQTPERADGIVPVDSVGRTVA